MALFAVGFSHGEAVEFEIHLVTNNSHDEHDVCIHNGHIAWTGLDGDNNEIFHWNGVTIEQISNHNSTYAADDCVVHDGTIAYEVFDGNDWKIYYWDRTTTYQLTDHDTIDTDPHLYNGKVARMGGTQDIYYWDGSTGVGY